jgi:hypothetical protein
VTPPSPGSETTGTLLWQRDALNKHKILKKVTYRLGIDKESVAKDNELFDLPTNQDKVIGAEQVESEENALAKRIEQENAQLDRELRGICRGC